MTDSPTRPRPTKPVTKTMQPHDPGAKKWSQRYGAALVCVRYRQRTGHGTRYTTVELIVDQMPLQQRTCTDPLVEVPAPIGDAKARVRAMELGATWDSTRRVWRMPLSVARKLRLPMREAPPRKLARSAHRD